MEIIEKTMMTEREQLAEIVTSWVSSSETTHEKNKEQIIREFSNLSSKLKMELYRIEKGSDELSFIEEDDLEKALKAIREFLSSKSNQETMRMLQERLL